MHNVCSLGANVQEQETRYNLQETLFDVKTVEEDVTYSYNFICIQLHTVVEV